MVPVRALLLASVLPLALAAQETTTVPASGESLPIKRVVLYKNGVGYFEHLGSVQDRQDVNVSFTSGQLNDVLKSLTVLDLNGGRITGVGYGSSAPVARQLDDLRLPVGEKPSLTEFLSALRGARIEIRGGATVLTGKLLSVDRKTRISGGNTVEIDYVSMVGDNGEIRTTELAPSFSVKLLDRGLATKVDRYLDLAASGRESDARRLTISADGSGKRSIFVSYVSEVPIWKSTYRLVLNPKPGERPLLQGWAIVDNTVGQDWDKVSLSLVAGAPQSFIQNLSQPYYSRRPVIDLPESFNAAPQTYQATLMTGSGVLTGRVTDPGGVAIPGAIVRAFGDGGALAGETSTDASGAYTLNTLPDGLVQVEVDSPGFKKMRISGLSVAPGRAARRDVRLEVGAVTEAVEVIAEPTQVQTESSMAGRSSALGSGRTMGGSAIEARKAFAPPPPPAQTQAAPMMSGVAMADLARAQVQAASAQALGDLFEYKLQEPVTVQKNRSALVPIVQASVNVEKVSVWNDRAGLPRPRRALWLTNSTGLTLDGGSFTVLEENAFAGEGIFDPIRPDEKRLISYAVDLPLNATSRSESEPQRVTRAIVNKGVLVQRSEIREKRTYTFRNEDTSARAVIVEHPVRAGYQLRSEAKPAETTADWLRFRLRVEPKQTASLVIEEARPTETTYAVSNIDSSRLDFYVRQKSIDKTIEDGIRKVLAQKAVAAELDSRKEALDDERESIYNDQQRIRENMKSLKGSAEEKALLQRYTQQLNQQETRLDALKKEMEKLDAQIEKADAEVDRMIEALSFDVVL